MSLQNSLPLRLAKAVAQAGVCSRREAETLIKEGHVTVNHYKTTDCATVITDKQTVRVDGKMINWNIAPKLWLYHKPKGLITTHDDPQGRPTVFEHVKIRERVISVGRLDFNTEGLLLLTNSGELARIAELPSTGWIRTYKVRIFGKIDQKRLDVLQRGIKIGGIQYKPFKIEGASLRGDHTWRSSSNQWLTVHISEGKNREVRKAFAQVGLQVNRLIRTHYGPFALGDLAPGAVSLIATHKLKRFFPGLYETIQE